MPRTQHISEAYKLLLGHSPSSHQSKRERMILVMLNWRPSAFLGDEPSRRIGVLALCQIGLCWHEKDNLPFSFQQVADRLKELEPELADEEVSASTLLSIENRDRRSGGP